MSVMKLFIMWDESRGSIPKDEYGCICTSGLIGEVTEENTYLRYHGKRPEGSKRYSELNVGECVAGVKYALSESKGVYSIYRVK